MPEKKNRKRSKTEKPDEGSTPRALKKAKRGQTDPSRDIYTDPSGEEVDKEISADIAYLALNRKKIEADSDKAIAKFRGTLRAQKENFLQTSDEQADAIVQRNLEMQRDLLSVFRQCYAQSSHYKHESSHELLASNRSLDQFTSSLLSASKLLLKKYDSLNTDSQQLEQKCEWTTHFKEDGQKLGDLLDHQSKKVYREIEAILEGKGPSVDHGPEHLDGNGAFWARFTSSRNDSKDGDSGVSRAVEWVNTINKAHRAVAYLSKCFEMDEEELDGPVCEPVGEN